MEPESRSGVAAGGCRHGFNLTQSSGGSIANRIKDSFSFLLTTHQKAITIEEEEGLFFVFALVFWDPIPSSSSIVYGKKGSVNSYFLCILRHAHGTSYTASIHPFARLATFTCSKTGKGVEVGEGGITW